MVTTLEALILGAIQGITEWLPVSSSGHLVLAQHYMGVGESIELDAFLHFATFLVVIAYFRDEVKGILKELVSASKKYLVGKKIRKTKNLELAFLILVASVPTGLIGVGFKDILEGMYADVVSVSLALIVTGAILYASKPKKDAVKLDWACALIIGLSQGLAIIPGISRSGATIACALFLGVERKNAGVFSFLIFIPAAIGGIILEGGGVVEGLRESTTPFIIGFATSALVGYVSLAYLMKVIKKGDFYKFAYYVIPVGLISLAASSIL